MKKHKYIVCFMTALMIISFPAAVLSEKADDDDIEEELLRQLDGIDFSGWDAYFQDITSFLSGEETVEEYVLSLSDSGTAADPGSLFDSAVILIKNELKGSFAASSVLCALAILTSVSVLIPDTGVKKTLSVVLCASAAAVSIGVLGSFIAKAETTMRSMSELSEKSAPIIAASLAAIGSGASMRILSPIFALLSNGVILTFERAAIPLVIAFGILSAISVITDGERLDGLISFLRKAVKWILGLISTVYFGVVAVNGLTAAARDGVMIRTSKYALDKMVPVVGGMIGGTVDSVMGCALLVKNGIGTCALIILFAKIARPAVALASGSFMFRIAAAISGSVSDKRVIKLYKSCAETVSYLFACVAVSAMLFALTVLILIASGGIAAGLW